MPSHLIHRRDSCSFTKSDSKLEILNSILANQVFGSFHFPLFLHTFNLVTPLITEMEVYQHRIVKR